MERVRDYEALIRELLAGVAGGWSYGGLVGWLLSRNLKDRDLAQWLREHGAVLGADAEMRAQLGCLAVLGQGELAEVAGDLIKGWESQVEEWKEWFDRGYKLFGFGRYEEEIASYEKAIAIKPDYYEAWYYRGIALGYRGSTEEAIASFECAIEIEPNDYAAWHGKGVELGNLGKHEEAMASFNRAIEIKPNFYQAWFSRGIALAHLGKDEEAISSFNQAIEIQHDCQDAWFSRGIALAHLGKHEEAISSFNRAIEINPNFHQAWSSRGNQLGELGQYKDALTSSNRAIEIKSDFYLAWFNRGCSIGFLQGYDAKINTIHQAFEHIQTNSHPEGWGYLQREIGRTHYQEGKKQLFSYRKSPQSYYDRSLIHYHNALQTLTREEFPKLRIETLIDTAKVHLAQNNTPAAHQCKTEAFKILQDLLNAQPTFTGKKRLQIEYVSLRQLDVDLFVASGDNINALKAAELNKNNHLTWLLSALAETTISPSYEQMRQLLGTKSVATTLNIRGLDRAITLPLSKNSSTGTIYWHLSPDNLTTFILTANDSQPLVWESDRRQQAQQLAKWIKEWDTQYRDYGSKNGSKKSTATPPSPNVEVIKDEKEHHPWRKNLPDYLAQLSQILEIDKICAQLPTTLTHLILIPHSDLHRFPLHTLFLASTKLTNLQGCTYLPSIQIGLNLQQRSISSKSYTPLLSVEDPQTHQAAMPLAQIESTIVRHLLEPNTHINSISANLATVEDALKQPHASFHFTGHAAYNSRFPEASALALTDEPLTAKRISQLDLSSYNLITLAACETAITGRENINTEYVGLTSAFLQAGAANILSTLWQVDEIANAWFTIYFYQQLLTGKSPAVALAVTQKWMQTLTWQNLAEWLTPFGSLETVADYVKDIFEKEGKLGLDRPTKYSHPYYWAAFTLTGQG